MVAASYPPNRCDPEDDPDRGRQPEGFHAFDFIHLLEHDHQDGGSADARERRPPRVREPGTGIIAQAGMRA
jgi:hypothetical protein